jgi:hypothetical protein
MRGRRTLQVMQFVAKTCYAAIAEEDSVMGREQLLVELASGTLAPQYAVKAELLSAHAVRPAPPRARRRAVPLVVAAPDGAEHAA